MSLLRHLQLFCRTRPLGGAGRAAAAALLLAAGLSAPGLAAPGPAPVPAAPAAVAPLAPLAPQVCQTVVSTTADNGAGSLRAAVACAFAGHTVTFDPSMAGNTILLT